MSRREFLHAIGSGPVLVFVWLPIAYVTIGRLGLLLAVSPGYATAVFLPAGIAVGATFMTGPAALPGIFIGALVLNAWIGYSITHTLHSMSVLPALVIAFASLLQAGVGGAGLRRLIGYPAPLDNPRDILLYLLFAPILCLTSATVSIAGMWMLGVVPAEDVPVNWVTWWVGDTLGVLVALPLMLVLAGEPRTIWQLRFWYVAVPMILFLALFVATFIRVRSWEETQSLTEFQVRSQQLTDSMKAALAEQGLSLQQLSAAFIHRKDAVDRTNFRGLTDALLQRSPMIQAIEWAPRITTNEREAFETTQRRDIPGFEIREREISGEMRRAGDRAEFFPVTYIEPLAGNDLAAGFDLASEPARQSTIEAALSSSAVIATSPIRLVQERGEQAGILLIQGISSSPSGPGIVLVVLRMGSFAATFLAPLQSSMSLRLIDLTSSRPLFDDLATAAPRYESTFNFGTRRYLVQTSPSARYLADHRGWQSWLVLGGGVLGTGLLGALLMLGTGHAYRIRAKEEELEAVIDRTPFMLTRCSRDLCYRFVSQSYAKMLNRRPEEFVGKPIVEVMGKQGFTTIFPHVQKVLRGEPAEYESEVPFQGIGTRVLRVVYTPDTTEDGNIQGWIASMLDVTDQKQAESQRDLLIAEVNHRVKNTLATVISIAHQSFRRQQPSEISVRSFGERIRALAQTHTRLAEANWSGVDLQTLVADEIAPYRTERNVFVTGQNIRLTPKCALSLGMALHELTANAAKYGALSTPRGSVKIAWDTASSDGTIRLNWIETGGPKVDMPQRSGFGRRLLEKVLAPDLNGAVELDFRQEGLTCLITFPLDRHAVSSEAGVLAPANAALAERKRLRTSGLFNGAKALIVEDEALLALELDEVLRSAGFNVVGPFGNLAKALQAAKCESIDIAILDTNLNGEMVYPVASELALRGVPFLFLTGYDSSNLPEHFRPTPRMSKPFDHLHLIDQVKSIMSKQRSGSAVGTET